MCSNNNLVSSVPEDGVIKKGIARRYPIYLFDFADGDIAQARSYLNKGEYVPVFLYAYRAAENALRGFLECNETKVHQYCEVVRLMRLCSGINSSFVELEEKAYLISVLYATSRHSDDHTLPAATAAFEYAKEIVDFCRNAAI